MKLFFSAALIALVVAAGLYVGTVILDAPVAMADRR